MATNARQVAVRFEYLWHDARHWCVRCVHATGLRMWVAVHLNDRMHLQERRYCTECGGRDILISDGD